MEKLTIKRLGEIRQVSGTNAKGSYSFQSIGFTTEQYEGRWYNFAFKTEHGLEVGKEYDFEVKETVKNDKTYYNAAFLKKGSLDSEMLAKMDEKLEMILNRITSIKIAVDVLYERTKPIKPSDSAYSQENPKTAFDDDVPFDTF